MEKTAFETGSMLQNRHKDGSVDASGRGFDISKWETKFFFQYGCQWPEKVSETMSPPARIGQLAESLEVEVRDRILTDCEIIFRQTRRLRLPTEGTSESGAFIRVSRTVSDLWK
jgi:hypothetical protein